MIPLEPGFFVSSQEHFKLVSYSKILLDTYRFVIIFEFFHRYYVNVDTLDLIFHLLDMYLLNGWP